MESVLLAVALASGVVALVMCAIALKIVRDERRRADARVEALVAMADESEVPMEPAHPNPPPLRSARSFEAQTGTRELEEHDLELRAGAIEPRAESSNERPELFARIERPSPWPRRIAAAAAALAVIIAGSLALGLRRDGTMDSAPAHLSVGAAPLELLSLNHMAEPGVLTISGLVQNPRGGTAVSNVTAVAFLFAQDGGFVASGRAPLDYTRLEAGNNSPFVVKVPAKVPVARYRISFRGADGAIIAHIDKRTARPIARK